MTEKIKNSIDWFNDFVGFYSLSEDEKKMFYFAIRSLEAWEEVLNKLEKATVKDIDSNFADAYGIGKGLQYAIDIINQHLAKIEEVGEQMNEESKLIENIFEEVDLHLRESGYAYDSNMGIGDNIGSALLKEYANGYNKGYEKGIADARNGMNEIVQITFKDLCKNCTNMGIRYCEDSHCEVESFCKLSKERKLCDSKFCPLIYRGSEVSE